MVFWATVGGVFLVLIGAVEWLDRKRRGAPLGRRSGEHESAIAEAQLKSWDANPGRDSNPGISGP